jgi:thiopeptide-type bacteriocin biosynthesis protein
MAILRSTPGDAGLEWRWRLGVCGVDLLLDALGFSLGEKRDWARRQRDAFAREFHVEGRQKQQLGATYRSERETLGDVLHMARTFSSADEVPAIAALQARSVALAPIVDQLRRTELTAPVPVFAASYAHMHLNRLLRSAHRFQEMAIYELLDRTYRSESARRSTPDDVDQS